MITYGGIALRDATAPLSAWLMAAMPLQQAFGFFRPRRLGSADLDPRPHLNWFLNKPLKINTFLNPWGASRWGYGCFLIDQTGLDAIRTKAYADGEYTALPLVMDDQLGGKVTTDLFMLPPVPLTGAPLSATDIALKVSLLVLVDERYFWYERSSEITVTENTDTWDDLYTAIASALGIALSADPLVPSLGPVLTTDPVATSYLSPSVFFAKDNENLPMMLDCVAESVGQRIVRTLDGNFYARNASTAKSLMISQAGLYRKLAGGSLDLGAVNA